MLAPQQQPEPLPPKQLNNYWFILGREALLASAEISAVLGSPNNRKQKTYNTPINNILKINTTIDPSQSILRLGGTIKIGHEIGSNLSRIELENKIIEELKKTAGKIHFGISYHGQRFSLSDIQRLGLNIKKQLKQQQYSIRYVANREITLNSASVVNNGLLKRGKEFLISDENEPKPNDKKEMFDLAVTEAVQPFEDFGRRDFGRPGRDNKSGMLPPKLAMMLINLAQAKPNDVILDPFCGSGTILSEAMLMKYTNLIGSDISAKAIEDVKNNIDWVIKSYKLQVTSYKIKLEQSNVDGISNLLKSKSVNMIITEPYLGKPLHGKETKEELQKQVDELKQLYLSAFAEFKKILKKDGVIIFVIPRFKFRNDWIIIDCLEKIKKLGFSPEPLLPNNNFLLYHRPNQYVGREIWRFKYTD